MNNTQTAFLNKKLQPHLPALNETLEPSTKEGAASGSKKGSPKRNKFFFATRQPSETVGEKEDPLRARRLKLSQVALQDDGRSKDSTIAGFIYRNEVAT